LILTSAGFLSVYPGVDSLGNLSVYNSNTGISFVQSANNTITSYFQTNRTMRVRVNAWYNSFIATQQTPVMSFWNITDSVHEIWSQNTYNNGVNYNK
jgi:hypothetical protein